MVEVFGKFYYIDLEAVTERCRTESSVENTEGEEGTDEVAEPLEINIFKYEILKMCIDRVLNEFDDSDESMGPFAQKETTLSFKLAFNTLIKNDILIDDYE